MGGHRPNAGRKPRLGERNPKVLNRARRTIEDATPELIALELELARGVYVEDPNDETKVYKRPPDRAAIEFLLNHAIGKPADRTDITSNGQTIGQPAEASGLDIASRVAQILEGVRERVTSERAEEEVERTDPPTQGEAPGKRGVGQTHLSCEKNNNDPLQHRLNNNIDSEQQDRVRVRQVEI